MLKKVWSFFYNNEARGFFFQVVALVAVFYVFYIGIDNLFVNIEKRGIRTGFGFLQSESGFDLAEHLIDYTPASTNLTVFYVGIINTLLVSAVGIFFATLIGLVVGIARLSRNYLVARLAGGYIELLRNIPILLQILFWYNIVLNVFPHPRESFDFVSMVFVNNRGIYFPELTIESGFMLLSIFFIALVAAIFAHRYVHKKHQKSGRKYHTLGYLILFVCVFPVMVYFLFGGAITVDYPQFSGFNFKGGVSLSPEFLSLVFALSIYTATYIAEAVRSGIESVDKGQKEAASALGLRDVQSLRLIILPQALRVAIPPIINQYLNLTKNSSLAAAIGYSELVTIFTGTVLNQVGQAVEIILMTMAVYLTISLAISLVLNIANRKMAIKENE